VTRGARRAKTDRLDAVGLLRVLAARFAGDPDACRIVNVPSVEQEDAKRLQSGARIPRARAGPNRKSPRRPARHPGGPEKAIAPLPESGHRRTENRGRPTAANASGRRTEPFAEAAIAYA
jgi:hypothetical protein